MKNLKSPKFGNWSFGKDDINGQEVFIKGWKFTDCDGQVGIFSTKAGALAAHKSVEAWEKYCGYGDEK